MVRLCALLCVLLAAAACPQSIEDARDASFIPPMEPPDAAAPGRDAGRRDAGAPDAEGSGLDAAAPGLDAAPQAGLDASPIDLGACAVSPSPARVAQPVAITCATQPSMSGPSWSVDGLDGGFVVTPGSPAGAATFTLQAVPKNFPDTTLRVRARWHGSSSSSDGEATATVPVLGNLWLGKAKDGYPTITAFTTSPDYQKWGSELTDVVGVTEFDDDIRGLGLLSNGDVLVAQNTPTTTTAPVIVIGRADFKRDRLRDFEAMSGTTVLFDPAKSAKPRAVQQMSDGTVWVTGGPLPVIYTAAGKYQGRPTAAAKPAANTLGLAQLASGEVAVSMGSLKVGIYSLDGSSYREIQPLSGGDGYSDIEAIAVRPNGNVVLALSGFRSSTSGGLLAEFDSSFAFVRETPVGEWTYYEVASALAVVGDEIVASPKIDGGAGQYPYRYDANLNRVGYLGNATGMPSYRGIVRLK